MVSEKEQNLLNLIDQDQSDIIQCLQCNGTSCYCGACGGKGTIFGTFIGVLIIGSLESGIVALGLSGCYVQFINGLMITSAVTIYAIIQRKKS